MTPAEYAHSYAANPAERVRLDGAFTEAMAEAQAKMRAERDAAVGKLAAYELLDRIVRESGGDLLERWAQEVGARKTLADALMRLMAAHGACPNFENKCSACTEADAALRAAGRLP